MRVSAEGFLIINFLMNFLIMYLACRGTWFLRCRRLMTSSAFASVYALVDAIRLLPLWADVLSILTMLLLAFPLKDFPLFSRAAVYAMSIALMLSGLVRAILLRGVLPIWACLISLAIVIPISFAGRGRMMGRTNKTDVRVRALMKNRTCEFTALVDTGNLLTEPVSALPVLIADEKALGRMFFLAGSKDEHLREVEYASVGGSGRMRLVRPDRMEVYNGKRWVTAPEMWVGLFPGKMNRGIHALAPGAVLRLLSGK
ncbi:MAG: sigma-E processing peptidase SpoIIGA [Clostridia bacterium]|nr:sigma-E processing peptidase SpoIIGA [Clostridia bacterium]MBQ4157327.1 sigma-E processing peptidase SpoIIGA [Clostridia bacterium]